jgi:hypothetical protein
MLYKSHVYNAVRSQYAPYVCPAGMRSDLHVVLKGFAVNSKLGVNACFESCFVLANLGIIGW